MSQSLLESEAHLNAITELKTLNNLIELTAERKTLLLHNDKISEEMKQIELNNVEAIERSLIRQRDIKANEIDKDKPEIMFLGKKKD